jgi:serine/threonine protein kinase
MALNPLLLLLAVAVVVPVIALFIAYVLVPMARGTGWILVNTFRGIGWFIAHLFEYVGGTIGDAFRFISTIPAMIVLSVMTLFSVAIGRWSSAAHFGRSVQREFVTAGTCLYGVALRRPLKLLWLHGLLSGIEDRVPEALAASPGRDRPARHNQFDGYTIIGSLPSGGSGAKLYIAEPDAATRARVKGMPEQVVIKSFALEEGSALPQIVRESRALESAKKLKAVYEHGMDASRFWYAMPYYRGDHLGIITRQLHAESGENGLDTKRLRTGVGYVAQLAETLLSYHREGLWHKDVKPENVIIGADGAHLVDLGLVTPLHSAMTLTTHGTEYFRDPELVRQALRGVKVHQVDGAKFDVFGIGAVLFFLIENDFPAHGPLSRFSKKSPDAIKWIIRRAMADYHHRYDSAEQLVADLRVVAGASDPFAVRPGELPSVRDRADAADAADAADESPVEESVVGARPSVGPAIGVAAAARGSEDSPPAGRPRIRRKGFFSSAYDVLDDTDRLIDESMGARAADVTVVGFGVGTGTGLAARERARTIRREARARMKAARQSASKARRRAARHVRASSGRRRPIEGLAGATVLAVLVAGGIAYHSLRGGGGSDTRFQAAVESSIKPSPGPGDVDVRPAVAILSPPAVRDLAEAQAAIARVTEQRERQGYDVIELPSAVTDRLIAALTWWEASDHSPAADDVLEEQLEAWGLYGLVEVRGFDRGEVDDRLIFSTRKGADQRVPLTRLVDLPNPALPLLLVNDHPRHVTPAIAGRVDQMVASLQELGWTVTRDAGVEADLRTVLPIRSDATDVPMTPVLAEKIQRHDLGGVLRVIGQPGDETGIVLQIVRPDEVRARTMPMPPAIPAPPSLPGPRGTSQSGTPEMTPGTTPGTAFAAAAGTALATDPWITINGPAEARELTGAGAGGRARAEFPRAASAAASADGARGGPF